MANEKKKTCNVELKSYIKLYLLVRKYFPQGWGLSWQLVAVLRFAELLANSFEGLTTAVNGIILKNMFIVLCHAVFSFYKRRFSSNFLSGCLGQIINEI